jgi:Ca2+-binding RTX toxin-like protein
MILIPRIASPVIAIVVLLLLVAGFIPIMMMIATSSNAIAKKLSSSDVGTTNLKNLGNKIKGLETPPNSVRFGNTITCAPLKSCIGTNNDDIILPGAGELVFALDGKDMVFGALSDQVYGGNGADIIILGAGHALADGGSGDDSLFAGLGNDLLSGGSGNDKLFAGPGTTVMNGGSGANHFDCPLSVAGLARGVVLDYNPSNGDTISGSCKLVNTVGNANNNNNQPNISLPDTGDTSSGVPSAAILGGG